MTYDSGASQLAPWLTIGVKRASTREEPKSSSESVSDPYSRLTDIADAEIQEIIPVHEKELLAIEDGRLSTKLPSNQELRSRSVSRQQSRSRPSSRILNGFKSRSPTKLPRIQTSGHFDEEEEDKEEANKHLSDSEEDMDEELAPWLTPTGVKKERRSAKNRSRSPKSQMNDENETEEETEHESVRSKTRSSRLKSRSRSQTTSQDPESEKSASAKVEGLAELSDSSTLYVDKTSVTKENSRSRSRLNEADLEIEKSKEMSSSQIRDQTEPLIERTQSAKEMVKREKTDTLKERSKSHMDAPKKTEHKSEDGRLAEPLLEQKQESKPPEILIQESTRTFVKEGTPRERSVKERSRSPKEKTVKERSRLSKEKIVQKKSRSPQRTRSSFEKPRLPEVRPRSFMSEGHEDEQKDSGIEQSDMSDTGMETVTMEMVAREERTKSAINRSSSAAGHQQRSRSRSLIPASDHDTMTLELQARTDFSKSPSKSLKSSSDNDKIQYLDNGTPVDSKTRPSSHKTSLQEHGQTSRLTSDSGPLDLDSRLDGEGNDYEEELNLPGLSAIGGESVTDDVKTSRASRKKSRRDSYAGI